MFSDKGPERGDVRDQHVRAFADRYASDATFAESMDAALSMSDAVRIATEHGYPIEPADILSVAGTGQLTDEDLEQAGGGHDRHATLNADRGCVRY